MIHFCASSDFENFRHHSKMDAVDHPEIPMGVGDTIDAGTFDENDPTSFLFEEPPVSNVSQLSSTPGKQNAGDVLMQKSLPPSNRLSSQPLSAGAVLTSAPISFKSDEVISVDEVFSDLDASPIEFLVEGASDAVKHFFGVYESKSTDDEVDAGGEVNPQWNDPYRSTMQVQTAASHGASPIQPSSAAIEDEFKYKMDHPERGCFLIFNQKNFNSDLNMDRRDGTEKDAANLEKTAKDLGFEYVRVFNDCTKKDLMRWIDMVAEADHSDYDCLICCILTHGGNNDKLYAKDDTFQLKDITRPFNADKCPSLAGKPKLFFVQACRGFMLDAGTNLRNVAYDAVDGSVERDTVDGMPVVETQTIPVEADFLIGQSTVLDYYSWRNKSNGSIFIQHLCACLHQYGHTKEIMQVMTRVNRMTAYEFQSSSERPEMNRKKQIPSITTRLTAELCFVRKVRAEPDLTETDHLSVQVDDRNVRGDNAGNVCNGSRYNSTRNTAHASSSEGKSGQVHLPENFYPPPLPPKKSRSGRRSSVDKFGALIGSAPGTSRIPVPNKCKRVSVPDVPPYSRSLDTTSPGMHRSRTASQVARRLPLPAGTSSRRSFPNDLAQIEVTDDRLRIGYYRVNSHFDETAI